MQVYECIFSLITGVGVFILAMKIMSDSLKEIAGERMKTLLEKLASNRIKGVLVGALVTSIIQSSSATTVMVIGFVNANVMTLNQAASIIIGSNIGTTATGLLASLESLNISLYLSMLVFIGVMLSFIKKLKKLANLLTGLGMIFVGLKLMSNACNDDSIKDCFSNILQKIDFPLLLELLGILFTAIIQSSSAMTGIVIVMVGNKVMTMENGLFITLGANVGTCITALIGIIGANINSKRTAVIHFIFNICGCLLFTPILWIFKTEIIDLLDSIVDNHSMQIAYFHLIFNTVTAIITMPAIDCLVKIAKSIVSDEKPDHLIVETMEEKSNFEIGRNTTTTNINLDEINSSNNLNENTVIDISYLNDENKYEPPIILENYFLYKDKLKNEDDKDEENDDFNELKNSNDNVELIAVKEINEKKDIEENNEKVKKKENISNKENEEKEIEKNEENKENENILINENIFFQIKKDNDMEQDIKQNIGEKNIDDRENISIKKDKEPTQNLEEKNERENNIELKIDKTKEKNIANNIKEIEVEKIDKKYEDEKDCQKLKSDIENYEN